MGGDTVEIRNKELYANNTLIKDTLVTHQEPDVIPAGRSNRGNLGPAKVPDNSFFVMSDNRDRSLIKIVGLGGVDKSKAQGTARRIYRSWDSKKHSVRWERLGKRLLWLTHVRRISPDSFQYLLEGYKNVNLPCTTAAFTLSP